MASSDIGETFDVALFWAAVAAKREKDLLSWREIAHVWGVQCSTLTAGVKHNRIPRWSTLRAGLAWLGRPCADFLRQEAP